MTDTHLRSILKATTWQGIGLFMTTLISWAVTGSVAAGGAIAAAGMAVGLVTYVLHERIWARIGWGRVSASNGAPGGEPLRPSH